ncbi:MAG: DNA recombination protein RmuC [Odoribacteraceae bacterium]|jgi:DNA recombination protein RmuC|nr:DNA recombination protein RmuC [Odoribacteraceae bacterium]
MTILFASIISVALLVVAACTVLLLWRVNGVARGIDASRDASRKVDGEVARLDSLIREEFGRNREESLRAAKETREESSKSFAVLGESLMKVVASLSDAQKGQFETFSRQLETLLKRFDDLLLRQEGVKREMELKLKEIRETVEGRLVRLQEDNNKKLEEMRKTVDEKLQESVERRFNDSFRLINERLEAVHKGLGEMQSLAAGVGDLKKVLTNVKARGTFGEVQLGAILEQVLSPEQYVRNDHPGDDRKVVEYAIKLPSKGNDGEQVLLPVDSKFPVEDYQRLLEAYEGNGEAVEGCRKQFEGAVRSCAKDISERYIHPPRTTDFALLFVPAEGLYAEILRRPGFAEMLQQTYRVVVVGPTNLVAFLGSLQMGFRTLAIEKRSSEVWEILGAVKTEFGNFGAILGKTRKKLQEATNVIDQATTRTRVIERKLRTVQELPPSETVSLLGEAIADEGIFGEGTPGEEEQEE